MTNRPHVATVIIAAVFVAVAVLRPAMALTVLFYVAVIAVIVAVVAIVRHDRSVL